MKKFYSSILFLIIGLFANAQAPFITTWEIPANDLSIEIPIGNDINNYYTVNFGDGTVLNNQIGSCYHTYTNPGIYTVSLSGNFTFFEMGYSSDSEKLKTIEQWGDIQWTTMHNAFRQCYNVTLNANDTPDLSQVTDMSLMFQSCQALNQPINNWDVSNVENMYGLFTGATSFNQPLNNWNVSNVTDMRNMFLGASAFNQLLNNWDVSNVTSMEYMFSMATSFNQPLNNWDVSNVTNFRRMFKEAGSFNQSLNDWNVSSAIDLEGIFIDAISFNQPLNNWDISNVENISNFFFGATSFNQPLNDWDLSNITGLYGVFWGATSFNQPLDDWDVSNVVGLEYLFMGATAFNQPLNSWDVSTVFSMNSTFSNATSFNQPLSNWDVSATADMYGLFAGATAFNQDISMWDFNNNVYFNFFIIDSGFDFNNYDALLLKFIQLGWENQNLNSDGLEYCDENLRNYLINSRNWTISGDVYAEYCSGNTLGGHISYDYDNNGCTETTIGSAGILINADNWLGNYSSSSNPAGSYQLTLFEDSYNVILLNLPSYFTATPATSTVSFTGFGNTQTLDFCLTANEAVQDLNITLLPIGDARPGFEATYQLVASNIGTQTISNATVTLNYDTTAQTFVSATETADTVTSGQLGFTFATLQPFETKIINVVMQTVTPPTVNGGDVLNFTAAVTPTTGDYTINDNTFEFAQTVVNSFDPNDKRVVQGDEITIDVAGGYLDYIIRFQNTGTASAIKVRIADELSDMLDWNTLTPLSASHDYMVRVTEGNQVEFIFNNINLPAQQDDDAGSNGFIAYKIKPVQGIAVGDIIAGNAASIYFDYNLPIVTNNVATEVVAPTSGISYFDINASLAVYPNPATDMLHLEPKNGITLQEVTLYNLQGRQLLFFQQNPETLNLKLLSAGVYMLSVKTNQGIIQRRIIKQ